MPKGDSKFPSISQLESQIRDRINAPWKLGQLLKEKSNWYPITSALDAIGDAEEGLHAYLEMPETGNFGELYISTYGVLQLLYVEQDAVKTLSKILGLPYEFHEDVKEVRNFRNWSIGHPTLDWDGRSHYISRGLMSRKGFRLMSSHPDEERSLFRDVNIFDLIEKQRAALCKALSATLEKLKEDEMAHKELFKDQKLSDCFHSSTGWMVRKLYEAVWSDDLFPLGKTHVEILTKQVDEFEKGLIERELPDTASYEISKVRYVLSELEKFFKNKTESKFSDDDAEIFIFYIERHFVELEKIAKAIDEEYGSDVE
ncbi:MAG: hypothetical protein HQ512_14590 [Rhodospirillales bacterium]|nr:hypothetical protein [Rhodospirillales bacterium]